MPGATVFHLVRHASHGLLPHTLAGRMAGVGLSEQGRGEAAALAARLQGPIAAVVSSPMQRAQETAAAIAAGLGMLVEAGPAFNEVDFGAWSGLTFEALAPDPLWQRWNALRSLTRCPGGETMVEAQARALAGLAGFRDTHPGATIVIVSHADILKAILAAALGLSLDQLHRLTIDPASCSTLSVWDGDVRVEGINR